MAAITPEVSDFLGIPYPAEESDPFYEPFKDMVLTMEQIMLFGKIMMNMFVTGGGTLTWNGTTGLFSWTDLFQIVVPHWGFIINVQFGPDGLNQAAGLQNGQCLVVQVPATMSQNITVNFTIASQLNAQQHNNFVCATRIGSKLYLRNNGVLG